MFVLETPLNDLSCSSIVYLSDTIMHETFVCLNIKCPSLFVTYWLMLYFNLHSKVHPDYRIVLQVQHTSQTLQPEPSSEVPRTPETARFYAKQSLWKIVQKLRKSFANGNLNHGQIIKLTFLSAMRWCRRKADSDWKRSQTASFLFIFWLNLNST